MSPRNLFLCIACLFSLLTTSALSQSVRDQIALWRTLTGYQLPVNALGPLGQEGKNVWLQLTTEQKQEVAQYFVDICRPYVQAAVEQEASKSPIFTSVDYNPEYYSTEELNALPPPDSFQIVGVSISPASSGMVPFETNFSVFLHDPDGCTTYYYLWQFGDGGSSTQAQPFHTYTGPGVYPITISVTNCQGATDTRQIATVQVYSGPDEDLDGLPQTFEDLLAEMFQPMYRTSDGELSGTGFGAFEDASDAERFIQESFSGHERPWSYYRVLPAGIHDGRGYLRIDYLTLWNRDDGLVCHTMPSFLSALLESLFDENYLVFLDFADHLNDNERSLLRVSAPTVNGTYDLDPLHYVADRLYTAAHEGTIVDRGIKFRLTNPVPAGGHFILALSLSKHGTYAFNPNHVPLLPELVIDIIYGMADYLYDECMNNSIGFPWLREWHCAVWYYFADWLCYNCIAEQYVYFGQGFASRRINVGELEHPIHSCGFINFPEIREKLLDSRGMD